MPIVNRFADYHEDIVAWRHDLHRHPEILYEVHRTAAVVAEQLRSFGVDELATGIGRTGVVGVIRGQSLRERTGRRPQGGHGCIAPARGDRHALCLDHRPANACLRP